MFSISKFGTKLLHSASGAMKFGQKVTGEVDRIGHKVAAKADQAINMAAPFVGKANADKARAMVGVVKSGADMAHSANTGIRGVESAAHAGNVNQALNVIRTTTRDQYAAGKNLKAQSKSTLERVRK